MGPELWKRPYFYESLLDTEGGEFSDRTKGSLSHLRRE